MPYEGFTSITVREETAQLLNRVKEEGDYRSQGAAIEALFWAVGAGDADESHVEDENGEKWDEWIEAMEASKELPDP